MGTGLAEDEAQAHVYGVCFKTGPPLRTGVELEWLVRHAADGRRAVEPLRVDRALEPLGQPGGLPSGARLTREPGGQVELSSLPADSLADCVRAALADAGAVRGALAAEGLLLADGGLEPYRDPPRVTDHPRYRAMESYLDRVGPWGRMMMRATAAVQVNLDAGDEGSGVTGYRFRWELAHRLGPVLVAAFANSPLWRGRPTGWRSTRRAVWERMDPNRTRAPEPDADPRAAWARYALDAPLLCLRRDPPQDWEAPPGLTFRAWSRGAPGLRRPTVADLDYHLTTLFPPVRPRGWLELRMIDAQDGDGWTVPLALAATLLDDPAAARAAWEATEPLCPNGAVVPPEATWARAARLGPADPALGKAVRSCFEAGLAALAPTGADPELRRLGEQVAAFALRYAEQGRCPADDLLEGSPR